MGMRIEILRKPRKRLVQLAAASVQSDGLTPAQALEAVVEQVSSYGLIYERCMNEITVYVSNRSLKRLITDIGKAAN